MSHSAQEEQLLADRLSMLSILPDATRQLSPQTTSLPIESFTRFSDLPNELRERIWKFAMPRPRIINITTFISQCKCPEHQHKGTVDYSVSQVNQESRYVMLRRFSFCFKKVHVCGHTREEDCTDRTQIITFDPVRDTLYTNYLTMMAVNRFHFRGFSNTTWYNLVQRVEVRKCYLPEHWKLDSTSAFWGFSSLQQLHFIPLKSLENFSQPDEWCAKNLPRVKQFLLPLRTMFLVRKYTTGLKPPAIYLHRWKRLQVRGPNELKKDYWKVFEISEEMSGDWVIDEGSDEESDGSSEGNSDETSDYDSDDTDPLSWIDYNSSEEDEA